MSSKRAHCTVEGAGSSRIVVEVEHMHKASSSPLSKGSKPHKENNKRRKAAPKIIEFQVNSPLQPHADDVDLPFQAFGSLEPEVPMAQDLGDPFANWMRDFEDAAHATDPVEPMFTPVPRHQTIIFASGSHFIVTLMYKQCTIGRGPPRRTSAIYAKRQLSLSIAATLAQATVGFAPLACCLLIASSPHTVLKLGMVPAGSTRPYKRWGLSSILLVGDLNGFTEIQVRYCKHPEAPPKAIQLINAGFFPCSDKRPGTAFTLQLLDRLDAFNTVGRTSSHKVYAVLERATRPGFPDHVSDRYRELLAAYRKYLHVIKLRRTGHLFHPHPVLDVHAGDQAFDCVACPRPGFNFDWKEVPPDQQPWFRAWYSYDGNFRSYRKQKKVDAGDVCFSDGLAYFPPNELYDNWIRSQPEPKKGEPKPVCDNHKAGRDKSVKAANRDITGVGAFTCGSHSCVAPRGMVNFRKGERQIYCDIAFAAMYKYCSARGWLPIGMTMTSGVIANLPPEYELPKELDLVSAIGKWHLLGHIRGEVPKRVWAHFNEHSGSTSEQGPGQRIDSINNIAADWNLCKAIEMYICLPARYRDTLSSRERELANHGRLTVSLPRKTVLDWELEEVEPQDKNNNGNWTSPLMDPIIKGGFQEILQEEHKNEKVEVHGSSKRSGAVRWLAEGIEIEHSVQNLKDEEKTLGSKPTPGQANGITSKRIKLRDRVDAFLEKRSLYIFDVGDPDRPRLIDFVSEDGDWAEPVDLGMPSSYAYTTLADVGLSKMADLEARLRRGVCKDALESVKRQLRGKAATIRHKHTSNEISGTMAVTRAESAIQAQTTKILKTRWRYLNSRNALIQIGAPETNFDDYLDLKLSDLTPLSAFYDLYGATTGHGTTTMLWIWRSTVACNKEDWEVDALLRFAKGLSLSAGRVM
ncbi:hypothetical protein FRC09_011498 [Ceratobasidium sp. 395]|nr:hypothetical protein FRC09_011498 [Ceratobasidium sp. 395]